MSRYIATRAIRGSNALVMEAELMLHKALQEKGPDTLVEFPNTAYFLPTIVCCCLLTWLLMTLGFFGAISS